MNTQNLNLEQVIEFIQFSKSDSLHQLCDANLQFRFVGERMANKFGYTAAEILYKNLSQLDTPVNHLCSQYRDMHLPLLEKTQTSLNYLTIIPEHNYSVIQNHVLPLIFNNVFAGLYIKSKEINSLGSYMLIKEFIGNHSDRKARIIDLNKTPDHKNLSEKEELILYLIIFGKFDKEIAEILSKIYGCEISRDAITKCVTRRLYPEFEVISRSELIMASYAKGIWNHIPKLLIQYNNFL